ncbi:MAG: signal peptide peptidase SppA [Flavobacteriales bacterium]
MRQFLKFMLASMLGSFLLGIVMMMLFFGAIAAIGSKFSMETKATAVADGSVLRMQLDRAILDRGKKNQLNIDLGPFNSITTLGLDDILADIEKAKRDDRIKGIFLDLGMVDASMATKKEIRDKLAEFKAESGKPVVAFADVYTQGSYYLASVADRVYMAPQGDLDFRGLRSEMMFYTGLFEKLGVEVQFIRGSDNKYKSYGEAFTRKDMSEANKVQVRELLDGIWSGYLTDVAPQRKLDQARLDTIATNLLIRKASDAVAVGMVDSLLYRDQVLEAIKNRMDLPADKDVKFTELQDYTSAYVAKSTLAASSGTSDWKKPKVAIVYAQGDIVDGDGAGGSIGGASLSAAIRDARKDTTVKAIVLRVNSPGGSGLASDIIWREVMLAKAVKPVVVSMGDLAASGGYYISCAADRIFAEPVTITGSIGVFGMIPNLQGFFNDKLGITFDGVQTGKYSGMLTVNRPLTEEEKGIIQGYIDNFYSTFTQRVAEGRNMTVAQVDSIAQGRVWTGKDAMRLGLVDEMGGLEAATRNAAKRAGLDPDGFQVVGFPKEKDFLEQIRESMGASAKTWVGTEAFGADPDLLHVFDAVRKVKSMTGIQARMPFELEIH